MALAAAAAALVGDDADLLRPGQALDWLCSAPHSVFVIPLLATRPPI